VSDSIDGVFEISVDGRPVAVTDEAMTLLDVLREAGVTSVKDGCAPQGQCGCCTVLVDGAPRVSCVTPVRRMRGRSIVTVDGLDAGRAEAWASAFCESGASQCGFCTPGIICRLEGLVIKGGDLTDDAQVGRALQAHLCRCTGWTTIREAAVSVASGVTVAVRDFAAAGERATLEGRADQSVGPDVALGRGGFADDIAPVDALVAVPAGEGWAVAATLFEARSAAGKIQGRRTTLEPTPPIALPEGDWAVTLQTGWVDPAYLEPDSVWCEPGGEPVGPLLNGGAFGAKSHSRLGEVARRIADERGRSVRVVTDREWVVRNGAKRPPVAIGLRVDGSGEVRVAATHGIADILRAVGPAIDVVEVDVAGPPTSAAIRGAGWVELHLALAGLRGHVGSIRAPDGGIATAKIIDGAIRITVDAGQALDDVVLRSYAIGAAHMALGWIRSESIAVDEQGTVHDLTIRSFGVLRAIDTPRIKVEIVESDRPPVNGSDAVFAAVAAAVWIEAGCPPVIPTR